ncbi:hypothetical protein [Trichothermofontia sp.]
MKLLLEGQAAREKLLTEVATEIQPHSDRIEPAYQLAVILAMQGRTQEAQERLTQTNNGD